MLSFPEDSVTGIDDDNPSSGFGEQADEDDNFSDLLSASQVDTLFSDVGGSMNDNLFGGSGSFGTKLSAISQVESDEDYFSDSEKKATQKSTNLPHFQCSFHKTFYNSIQDFETHQIDHHTVNGRFLCGLCTKDYATKYLRRQHFAQVHIGLKYKCGFAGCGKWFKIKRTRDTHESSHQMSVSTDSKVNFVCERCNQMFDALDKLKIHKLTHSKTKKYVCRVCKQHGYTRASDRSNHEVKCCDEHKCEIVDGIVVPLPPTENLPVSALPPKPTNVTNKRSTAGAKKVLFLLDSDVTSNRKPDKSPEVIFLSDSENGKDKSPSARQSLSRNCKNGVKPGFYKNSCSPMRSSENSSVSRLGSPKASVKGKWKCTECKQQFRERHRLMEHINEVHSTDDPRFLCSICRVTLEDKKSFEIHKKQHEIDKKKFKVKTSRIKR